MEINQSPIFIVRCYTLDLASKEKRIVRERTWGFFHEESIAIKSIEENWTDMFENRYYNFAVVLEMPVGICTSPNKATWYFMDDHQQVEKADFDPINENRGGPGRLFVGW